MHTVKRRQARFDDSGDGLTSARSIGSCGVLAVFMALPLGCAETPRTSNPVPQPATSRPTAADDPVPQPAAPLPAEVAGFRFGMTVAEFEDHCKKVGTPNPLVGDDGEIRNHTCDQVEVEPGTRLNMFLGFCQGDTRLCEVNYWTNRDAAQAFTRLNAKLIMQYGPSLNVNATLRDEGLEEQCSRGDGKIRRTWWWGTPPALTGRVLIAFSCKPGDIYVGVYVDDAPGVAAQLGFAKGQGIVIP